MAIARRIGKPLLFVASLLPIIWFFTDVFVNGGGPDPGKDLVLFTGEWGIRFLLLTLLISPLRRWTGWHSLIAYRRMLGLYAGFYATMHFLAVMTYIVGWSLTRFGEEFSERPYMAVGIIAWMLMLPLIVTSNRGAMRLLKRRWHLLHRLIYVIAILVCVHIIWLVRSDYAQALFYSLVTAGLLGVRVLIKKSSKKPLV